MSSSPNEVESHSSGKFDQDMSAAATGTVQDALGEGSCSEELATNLQQQQEESQEESHPSLPPVTAATSLTTPADSMDQIENDLLVNQQETKRSNVILGLSLDHDEQKGQQIEQPIVQQDGHVDSDGNDNMDFAGQQEHHPLGLTLAMSVRNDSTLTAVASVTESACSPVESLSQHRDIQANTDLQNEEGQKEHVRTLSAMSSEGCLSLPDFGTNTTIDSADAMDDDVDDDDLQKEAKQEATPSHVADLGHSFHALRRPSHDASSTVTSVSTSSSHTIVTEALSVADSEDTATDLPIIRLDDEASDSHLDHHIMPQQPESFLMVPSSISAPNHNSNLSDEEEKTEVDEYVHMEDDNHKVKKPRSSTPPLQLPPHIMQQDSKGRDPGLSLQDDIDESAHILPPVIENKRAAFVSATVFMQQQQHHTGTEEEEASQPTSPTAASQQQHGLEFISVDGSLHIFKISTTGLFANTPLAPFDKVLRVNDYPCETELPENAAGMFGMLTGPVTVIAQNQGGVKDLVECQITKSSCCEANSCAGLVFEDRYVESVGDDSTKKVELKNELIIARIDDDSPFASALLHAGDEVIAINHCHDGLDANMAQYMLQSAPEHTIVLAKTRLNTQMAIARRPPHFRPASFDLVQTREEWLTNDLEREESGRRQGCYYNTCKRPGALANLSQWLGNVYGITIVIVSISIGLDTIKEQTIDESGDPGTLKFVALFGGGILLAGFLANAPWWCRRVGARFSIAQLVCNIIVIAAFFVLQSVFDGAKLVIFLGLFLPLLIIVNLPSVFVKREDGSDGKTISDRSSPSDVDELSVSTNSLRFDMV